MTDDIDQALADLAAATNAPPEVTSSSRAPAPYPTADLLDSPYRLRPQDTEVAFASMTTNYPPPKPTLSADIDGEDLADLMDYVNTPPTVQPLSAEGEKALSAALNTANLIPFEHWETLAYDLTLNNYDPADLAKSYDVPLVVLEATQANPYFKKILAAKGQEVKSISPDAADAAFVVKMRLIANKAAPRLLQKLADPSTSARDFNSLFRTAVELAQLQPKEDTPVAAATAAVVFNIQGVPGLEHLSSASAAPQVIDITPETTQTTPSVQDDELLEL